MRVICIVFTIILIIIVDTYGQSRRSGSRTVYSGMSISPNVAREEEKEIDVRVGRVVDVEGEYVIVLMNQYERIDGAELQFYVCDMQMNPVGLLEGTFMRHKNCLVYKVIEGRVIEGDIVMLKQIRRKRGE